jgi:hypothetical protein
MLASAMVPMIGFHIQLVLAFFCHATSQQTLMLAQVKDMREPHLILKKSKHWGF